MKKIINQDFVGERPLFTSKNLEVEACLFHDGESPLKESKNIVVNNCTFQWKYPLWYSKNIDVNNTKFLETARSGIWYTKNININDSTIDSPKIFRRSKNISVTNSNMEHADESLWNCDSVELKNIHIVGDYFGMNSSNITCKNVVIDGNYCFDGCENVEIIDSVLNSKDAIWNCKNVVIKNSKIIGEYLGWNSKNVTLINCYIESEQGCCYMDNLVLKDCLTKNTTLAFEYSSVKGNILNKIDSIKNPYKCDLIVEDYDELILEEDKVDITKTKIKKR